MSDIGSGLNFVNKAALNALITELNSQIKPGVGIPQMLADAFAKELIENTTITNKEFYTRQSGYSKVDVVLNGEVIINPLKNLFNKIKDLTDKFPGDPAAAAAAVITGLVFKASTSPNAISVINAFNNLTTVKRQMGVSKINKSASKDYAGAFATNKDKFKGPKAPLLAERSLSFDNLVGEDLVSLAQDVLIEEAHKTDSPFNKELLRQIASNPTYGGVLFTDTSPEVTKSGAQRQILVTFKFRAKSSFVPTDIVFESKEAEAYEGQEFTNYIDPTVDYTLDYYSSDIDPAVANKFREYYGIQAENFKESVAHLEHLLSAPTERLISAKRAIADAKITFASNSPEVASILTQLEAVIGYAQEASMAIDSIFRAPGNMLNISPADLRTAAMEILNRGQNNQPSVTMRWFVQSGNSIAEDTKMSTSLDVTFGFAWGGAYINNAKGKVSTQIITKMNDIVRRTIQGKQYTRDEVLAIFFESGSTPIAFQALFKALGLQKNIVRQSTKRKQFVTNFNLPKIDIKGNKQNVTVNTNKPTPKKQPFTSKIGTIASFVSNGLSSNQRLGIKALSIVELLNSNIQQQMVAEMGEPGLVNRTGKFASSVKITDALKVKDQLVINYEYLETPYKVFSKQSRATVWNSVPARDPAILIDSAIRALGVQFQLGSYGKIVTGVK